MRKFCFRSLGRHLAVTVSLFALCQAAAVQGATNASSTLQAGGTSYTYTPDTPIDPEHARPLMQKARSGEPLSADEQAYLDRVRQMLRKQRAAKSGAGNPPRDLAGQAAASATGPGGWQQLPDGTYGKELDYIGAGGISLS
jgi:hypothetical protein